MDNKEEEKNIRLDDSAAELYRQFAGIDDTDRADHSEKSSLMEFLDHEEETLDHYRLVLAKATCLFAGIVYNSLFAVLDAENELKIKDFMHLLKRIAEFPKFNGKIFCNLRGQQYAADQPGSEKYDYELSLGNFLVDYNIARVIEERSKDKGKNLYAKLMEAFKGLSVMDIFNFSIDFGAGEEEDYLRIENAIKYLVKFHHKNTDRAKFMVNDEYGQPNINLTLLAAANRVKPEALQNLVDKITPLMLGPNPNEKLKHFTTVYDVIIASKRYREHLKRVPIEVNNVQWLAQVRSADPKKTEDNVQASRLVLSKYGSNLKMASEVIKSISTDGYSADIQTNVMGKRLTLATEYFDLTETNKNKETLQTEALQNIQDGLNQIEDETYDSITIVGAEVSAVDEQGTKTNWKLHEKLSDLLSFFKRRSSIKKKVRDIANKDVQFDEDDYAVIAKNFKISRQEAYDLITLLRDCFDDNGNFRRSFFEQNVPEFLLYENTVFEFLWHYLKELPTRKDRVSFLNALQLLIAKLKQPQNVLNILLADIFKRKTAVSLSDRNGLMLGTILLRNFNRDARSNIELTPEEVLLMQEGLNHNMVDAVLDYFERNKENIIQKVKHITDLLLKSSSQEKFVKDEMQTRFLLLLMRELTIFLALTGGELAKSIIHGIVKEFGTPSSSFYKQMHNKDNLRYSLLLLQVAARAMTRFYDPRTDELLTEVISNETFFLNLSGEPSYQNNVRKVMMRIRQPE